MPEKSQVQRISTEAIIKACKGEWDMIIKELQEKLPAIAVRRGLLAEIELAPPKYQGSCPVHQLPYIRDTGKREWVCPVLGCGKFAGDHAECDLEIAAELSAEEEEKSRGVHGGGDPVGTRPPPAKWNPIRDGSPSARRIPLGNGRGGR